MRALVEDYDNARIDVATAKSLNFEAKPEDELAIAKVELLSLNSQLIQQRTQESISTFRDTVDQEMQKSRGETLQLLGLIGAVVAFLSVGTNIAIKIDDPRMLGAAFLLMGGVILTTFGGFWVTMQSVHHHRSGHHLRPDITGDNQIPQSSRSRELVQTAFSPKFMAVLLGVLMIVISLIMMWNLDLDRSQSPTDQAIITFVDQSTIE